jgi:2-succinyl-5-enolpyruvyl-6-hydroxy-3-cyclohexene-1-carboxylate synthase
MYGLDHHRTPDVAEALHRVATQLRTGTRATVVELMTDRSTERDAYRQDLADLLGLASPGEPRP